MKHFFLFLFLSSFFFSHTQVSGEWHTSFSIMGKPQLMDMTIIYTSDSTAIFLSNPDGSYEDIEMDNVVVSDSTVDFSWKRINFRFEGKYHTNGDSITGMMIQGDLRWTATFLRGQQELKEAHRPQTPTEPYEFVQEDLLIENGDITLGVSLVLPEKQTENYPIVILISGSGAQDRNGEILGHQPFFVIADHLAKHGIASLRFDDRGVGKSTGVFQGTPIKELVSDVDALIQYVRKQQRFKKHPLGLIGHSEGGMHAMAAAKGNCRVDFLVELASVGTTGKDVLIDQQYLVPKALGKSDEYATWNQTTYHEVTRIIETYDQNNATDPLAKFLSSHYDAAPEEFKQSATKIAFQISVATFLNNQWGRDFIAFESADYLKRIRVPILAINCERDVQVPAEKSQNGFKASCSKRSLKKSTFIVLEGLNHLFQTCDTCSVYEYGELEETFSPEALTIISDWILSLNR